MVRPLRAITRQRGHLWCGPDHNFLGIYLLTELNHCNRSSVHHLHSRRYSASTSTMASPSSVLIYLLRRDLRVEDNAIFHGLATDPSPFTHVLPVYVFPAQQMEVSGFIPKDSAAKSPYPEARSELGRFWRCGPHRAKFVAESVWDLKEQLEALESGLEIRVGTVRDVVQCLLQGFEKKDIKVGGVWITNEEGVEEKREEQDLKTLCVEKNVKFKVFIDEKYFIDEYVSLVMYLHITCVHFSMDLKLLTNHRLVEIFHAQIPKKFQMFSPPTANPSSRCALLHETFSRR